VIMLMLKEGRSDQRKVAVPPNRFSALKAQWMDIYTPIVDQLKLEIRMNTKSKQVELRVRKYVNEEEELEITKNPPLSSYNPLHNSHYIIHSMCLNVDY
jgi:hypothetical protein